MSASFAKTLVVSQGPYCQAALGSLDTVYLEPPVMGHQIKVEPDPHVLAAMRMWLFKLELHARVAARLGRCRVGPEAEIRGANTSLQGDIVRRRDPHDKARDFVVG